MWWSWHLSCLFVLKEHVLTSLASSPSSKYRKCGFLPRRLNPFWWLKLMVEMPELRSLTLSSYLFFFIKTEWHDKRYSRQQLCAKINTKDFKLQQSRQKKSSILGIFSPSFFTCLGQVLRKFERNSLYVLENYETQCCFQSPRGIP